MSVRNVSERDRHVHDAVHAIVAEQGFHVSMEAVAARVGCSKQTLYNRYGSKKGMLQCVMQCHLDLTTAPLEQLSNGDLREKLLSFAVAHLERLNDPAIINAIQLLATQARQFPDEIQTIHRDSVEALQRRLALWLDAAMRQGLIRRDDPYFVAELLLSMIIGMDLERKRLLASYRDMAQQRRWAEFVVDNFLRAFALHPTHS